MEINISEDEAKAIIREHGVSLDIHDYSSYVAIAIRCGLIPKPDLIIEENPEVTVE